MKKLIFHEYKNRSHSVEYGEKKSLKFVHAISVILVITDYIQTA